MACKGIHHLNTDGLESVYLFLACIALFLVAVSIIYCNPLGLVFSFFGLCSAMRGYFRCQ